MPASPDPLALLRRAIATRTCVIGTYNRGRVKLAPYLLYERDDAHFVEAETVERDGQPPREPKLGAFRIAGLGDLQPTAERFEPRLEMSLEDGKYSGGILAAV